MRAAAILALLATAGPVLGWEFTSTPVCRLDHAAGDTRIAVTYDPRLVQPYAIAVSTASPWPEGPVFAIRFLGPRGLTISTDRHALSEGGGTLTVTDQGFGNVLDGLEYNDTATLVLGDRAVTVTLSGAAEPVAAFRSCAASPAA